MVKKSGLIASLILVIIVISYIFTMKSKTRDTTSISYVNGLYKIDTNIILTNRNLGNLVHELQYQNLVETKNTQDIPSFVKIFLDKLTGSFYIVNESNKWNADSISVVVENNIVVKTVYHYNIKDTIIDFGKLQTPRQLLYVATNKNITAIAYLIRGIALRGRLIIVTHKDGIITDMWCGRTNTEINNKEDIIKYVEENKDQYWGLNTNFIYF